MNKERVDQIIAQYAEYKARTDFLKAEIPELHRVLESLERTIVDDEVTISQNLSGMPHGTKTSDPTGKLGAMLADGIDPPRIRDFKQEIAELERELEDKSVVVRFVDAWVQSLSPREKFVFMAKCVYGSIWRDVIYGYEKEFGDHYSKDSLKRIASAALLKIYNVAS